MGEFIYKSEVNNKYADIEKALKGVYADYANRSKDRKFYFYGAKNSTKEVEDIVNRILFEKGKPDEFENEESCIDSLFPSQLLYSYRVKYNGSKKETHVVVFVSDI